MSNPTQDLAPGRVFGRIGEIVEMIKPDDLVDVTVSPDGGRWMVSIQLASAEAAAALGTNFPEGKMNEEFVEFVL